MAWQRPGVRIPYGPPLYFSLYNLLMKINTQEKKEDILSTIRMFIDHADFNEIEERLEKHFKGFGYEATIENVYQFIFDILYENDLVYAVDWKWSLEDELGMLKLKIDDFEPELLESNEEEDFKVTANIKVKDKEYSLVDCSEYDFFDEINMILRDIKSPKRVFILEGLTGDTLYYTVVNEQSYYDLCDSNYLPHKYT